MRISDWSSDVCSSDLATILRAAADGRIGDKSVRQGQFVQAASRLMTLVPKASLYVEANFKETQLGLMRVGQPVKIEVDALPGVELPGRVASIAPGTGAQFSVLPPQTRSAARRVGTEGDRMGSIWW